MNLIYLTSKGYTIFYVLLIIQIFYTDKNIFHPWLLFLIGGMPLDAQADWSWL